MILALCSQKCVAFLYYVLRNWDADSSRRHFLARRSPGGTSDLMTREVCGSYDGFYYRESLQELGCPPCYLSERPDGWRLVEHG